MQVSETIKLGENSSSNSNTVKHKPQGFFWWFIAIVVTGCLAILSWSYCTRMYQLPEVPLHYYTLKKLGQLREPKAFTYDDLRDFGETVDFKQFHDKFHEVSPEQIQHLNQLYLRNLLRNHKHAEHTLFLEGRFLVKDIVEAEPTDLIPKGFILELQSLTYSEILKEAKEYPFFVKVHLPVNELPEGLKVGQKWSLTKRRNGLAVLKINQLTTKKSNSSEWSLDLVPLLSENFTLPTGKKISFTPTHELSI